MSFLATASNYLHQLHIAGLWEAKAHELAVKYGATLVQDEISFNDETKAAAFWEELEHWSATLRGGRNVGTQVSAVQGTTKEAEPAKAGDL